MRALILAALAVFGGAMVPGAARAQDEAVIDGWTIGQEFDFCYIRKLYSGPDGLDRIVSIESDRLGSWLGIWRSDWNFPDQAIEADIWFDERVDRPAVLSLTGTSEQGAVYIDGDDTLTDEMAEKQYVAVSIASLGILEGYELGATKAAVRALYNCADE